MKITRTYSAPRFIDPPIALVFGDPCPGCKGRTVVLRGRVKDWDYCEPCYSVTLSSSLHRKSPSTRLMSLEVKRLLEGGGQQSLF